MTEPPNQFALSSLTVDVVAIPAELRERAQWVLWRYEQRPGKPKPDKVPYRSEGHGRASSTDPSTWSSFAAAIGGYSTLKADGIGYVLSHDDPFVGVDLDSGMSEADREWVIARLASYSEMSPSGNGIRVLVRGTLNGHSRRKAGPFEVYDDKRFLTITGRHIDGSPMTIEDRQAELDKVRNLFLPAPARVEQRERQAIATIDLDDRELVDRACAARNGVAFEVLWAGRWEGNYWSQSEADLALCAMLAFWAGRDPDRVDRLFRLSGLYREKWERADYRERTITLAITG